MTRSIARTHVWTKSLARIAIAIALVWSIASPADASASSISHAGVVIRHGSGDLTYAYVSFSGGQISGEDLLKRTGLAIVTVSFGGLGDGICSIEREGCPATVCRRRLCQGGSSDDPFWQYFRQSVPGNWQAVALGASSTNVENGDVDGWSWTGTTAKLPPLTLAEIAEKTGADQAGSATSDGSTGDQVFVLSNFHPAPYSRQPTFEYALAIALILAAIVVVAVTTRHKRSLGP
jgi:hypothetical protein